MRSGSALERYEVFICSALLAAHSSGEENGFRQRDIKFYMGLFSNWLETSLPGDMLEVQQTQILRYLENLVSEGFARKLSRGQLPVYRLTRTGLVEITSRMVERSHYESLEQVLFVFYFVKSYSPRILELVKKEGKQFPVALSIELSSLLDANKLLVQEISRIENSLKQLEVRISDAIRSSSKSKEFFAAGMSTEETVCEIEKRFPYELNSQKPLSELFAEIPSSQRRWELETGALFRAQCIFGPTKEILTNSLKILQRLKEF